MNIIADKPRSSKASQEELAYFRLQLEVVNHYRGNIKSFMWLVSATSTYSEAMVRSVLDKWVYNPRIIQNAFYQVIEWLEKNDPARATKILEIMAPYKEAYSRWRVEWDKTQPLGNRIQVGANRAIPFWPEDDRSRITGARAKMS